MKYYVGKGIKFEKGECKEYKTLNAALKAATKDENIVVWDENGQIIVPQTDNAPGQKLHTDPDGSAPEFDDGGNPEEIADTESAVAGENIQQNNEQKDTQEGAEGNTPYEQEHTVIIPQGKTRVTVVCDGSLNLRRSPEWGESNICGRAMKGQSYLVKEIHMVEGKKMVRTIDDIYLSGASEHVQLEQL